MLLLVLIWTFLYENGCPGITNTSGLEKPTIDEPDESDYNYSDIIMSLVGDLNFAPVNLKAECMMVKLGLSVVKPYVGKNADVPSDATVLRVDYDSNRGAVLAEGINPWFSDIDLLYDSRQSLMRQFVK